MMGFLFWGWNVHRNAKDPEAKMGVFLDITEEIVQRPDGFIAFCVGAGTYWDQNWNVSAVHMDFNSIAKRLCD